MRRLWPTAGCCAKNERIISIKDCETSWVEIALPIIHTRVMRNFIALDLLKLCSQAKCTGGIECGGSS
jgi:hypothetical protein